MVILRFLYFINELVNYTSNVDLPERVIRFIEDDSPATRRNLSLLV